MNAWDNESGEAASTLRTLGRRRHYRVNCEIEISYRLTDEGSASQTATLSNIGLGGARVDFEQEINLPADLVLYVPGGADGAPLELPSRVVWTVADKEGGPYPTGLQFQDMSDRVRRELYDFISSMMT